MNRLAAGPGSQESEPYPKPAKIEFVVKKWPWRGLLAANPQEFAANFRARVSRNRSHANARHGAGVARPRLSPRKPSESRPVISPMYFLQIWV